MNMTISLAIEVQPAEILVLFVTHNVSLEMTDQKLRITIRR